MNYKFGINLLCFVILIGIYMMKYDFIEKAIGPSLTFGLLPIIIGVWGLLINDLFLKVYVLEGYKKQINILLIVLGLVVIVYGWVF